MIAFDADHWIYRQDLSDLKYHPGGISSYPLMAMTAPTPVAFLGQVSAEATISQLRQTRIQPSVIHLINLLLDGIIVSLISTAQSINPKDLRSEAVPRIFSAGKGIHESTGIKSLSRECVGEAELELRSWYELNPGVKKGFPPSNSGRGMTATKEQAHAEFPVREVVDVMRLRVSELSSYSNGIDHYEVINENVLASWRAIGGDPSDDTLEPAAAWLHAFVERICENLLQQLNRVVERDSSLAICGPQDLYTALAEDERFWGWFVRMEAKDALDEALLSSTRNRKQGSGPTTPIAKGRLSGLPHDREISNDSGRSTPSPRDSPNRGSSDAARLSGIANIARKSSAMGKKLSSGLERKESNLSSSIRRETSSDDGRMRSAMENDDEFDALVRSGETMKVSLTPSRLKTFESANNRNVRAGGGAISNSSSLSDLQAKETVSSLPRSASTKAPLAASAKPTVSPAQPGARQRLVARPATTIDEAADGEAVLSPLKSAQAAKQESLKELFAKSPADTVSQSPAKRNVPAVILGSPPPGHTANGRASAPGGSSPRPEMNDAASISSSAVPSSELPRPTKARSEARELADFFNSGPPPPSPPPASRADAPPLSAKSAKGFRNLMSKVTGSSKKKDEEARIARENAAWEIPTAPAPLPRHRRSAASVSTTRTVTASTHPSSSNRSDEAEMPNMPSKLPKRSEVDVIRTDSKGRGSSHDAVDDRQPAFSAFSEQRTGADKSVAESEERRQASHPSERLSQNQGTGLDSVNLPDTFTRPGVSLSQATESVHSLATAGHATHGDRSASTINTFVTANEGYESESVEQRSNGVYGRTTVAPSAVNPGSAGHGSGKESDLLRRRLVHGRSLLRYASSVEECRLLLDAFLTQLGVPKEAGMNRNEEEAEAQLIAALLDGESLSNTHGEDEQVTPKIGSIGNERLDSDKPALTGPHAEEEFNSEADSMASVDRDDLDSHVEVATSGKLSSPVRMSTMAPMRL